jgi:hypothetical protein
MLLSAPLEKVVVVIVVDDDFVEDDSWLRFRVDLRVVIVVRLC